MREYVESGQHGGGTPVLIHQRVFAGLEREAGDCSGLLFGSASPDEVVVEDFVPGMSGAQRPEAVGYFRVTSNEEELAQTTWDAGLLPVVLVFRREAEGLTLAQTVVKQRLGETTPSHRVLFRAETEPTAWVDEAETRPLKRIVWPVVAIAAGLALGAGIYTWVSGSGERPEPVKEARAPEPAPIPEADRVVAPPVPPPKADRDVHQEIRETLGKWAATMMTSDFAGHAELYAASVDPYFTKGPATRAEIADEVWGNLKRYGPMTTYRISDLTIAALDADHAIANYRKTWATAGRRFAGDRREQMKFAREGAAWRITSQQELKSTKSSRTPASPRQRKATGR